MVLGLLFSMTFGFAGVESMKLIERTEEKPYVYLAFWSVPDQVDSQIAAQAKTVLEFAQKQGLEPSGHPVTTFGQTDQELSHQVKVGYVVKKPLPRPMGQFFPGVIPKGKYLETVLVGAVDYVKVAEKVQKYVSDKGLETFNHFDFYETTVPEVAQAKLRIVSIAQVRKASPPEEEE